MRELTYVARRTVEWREAPDPVLQNADDAIVAPVAATPCDVDPAILAGQAPVPPQLVAGLAARACLATPRLLQAAESRDTP